MPDATNCTLNVDKEAERTVIFNIRNREAWLLETLLLLYIHVQHLKQDIFLETLALSSQNVTI